MRYFTVSCAPSRVSNYLGGIKKSLDADRSDVDGIDDATRTMLQKARLTMRRFGFSASVKGWRERSATGIFSMWYACHPERHGWWCPSFWSDEISPWAWDFVILIIYYYIILLVAVPSIYLYLLENRAVCGEGNVYVISATEKVWKQMQLLFSYIPVKRHQTLRKSAQGDEWGQNSFDKRRDELVGGV